MRDWFARTFGGAVADVREKLVEEAWFGRSFGSGAADKGSVGVERPVAEQLGWDRSAPTDHGIDR